VTNNRELACVDGAAFLYIQPGRLLVTLFGISRPSGDGLPSILRSYGATKPGGVGDGRGVA
jgi:hypothetical protein